MEKLLEAVKRGYVVSVDGIAYNKNGIQVGCIHKITNRKAICFRMNNKVTSLFTYRLQAFQKYGYKMFEKGIVVRHLNGNSLDNSWDNIVIGTQSDNMMDIPEQIRVSKAIHASSFLKKYNNDEVKDFHSVSKSYKKTMEHFNITSKGTLNYILKN